MPKSRKLPKLPKVPKGTAAQAKALQRVQTQLAKAESDSKRARALVSLLKGRRALLVKKLSGR